jgi:hypothetical protein
MGRSRWVVTCVEFYSCMYVRDHDDCNRFLDLDLGGAYLMGKGKPVKYQLIASGRYAVAVKSPEERYRPLIQHCRGQ